MRRWLAALALPLAFAASPALADKAANTIRFAYDQAPENVDPFFNNVRIGVIIGAHVWDTLVYRDPNTGEYKGQLATGWRQVDDRTIELTVLVSVMTFESVVNWNSGVVTPLAARVPGYS